MLLLVGCGLAKNMLLAVTFLVLFCAKIRVTDAHFHQLSGSEVSELRLLVLLPYKLGNTELPFGAVMSGAAGGW